MQLSPHEQERLLVHVAADVAEKRRVTPVVDGTLGCHAGIDRTILAG